MKVLVDKEQSFKPYKISITVETAMEEKLLFRVMLANNRVPNLLKDDKEITSEAWNVLSKMMGDVADAMLKNNADAGSSPV